MKFSLEARALGGALLIASLSAGGAGLAAILIPHMPNSSGAPSPPEGELSPIAIQGQQSYEMSCSDCHGDDGHGDEGPDLHNLAISNARITKVIKGGIKGQMPGYAQKYDANQIAALVSYLRTLR